MDPAIRGWERVGPPPAHVVRSFGAAGEARALLGGEGRAWRVGDVVVKPVDVPVSQLEWEAVLYDGLQGHPSFRVPTMIRAREGALAVDGWFATAFLPGRHEPRRWSDIIELSDVFHSVVATEPHPTFLDERVDPWSIGDRVAWGELAPGAVPETKHLERLADVTDPIEAAPQLVHGDLTGNVLFDDDLPPAILDLSPYFRPAPFASAIVVGDALVWEGADETLLHACEHLPSFPQYLVRALIYRIVTDRLFRLDQPLRPDEDDPYLTPVELAIRLAAAR